MHTSPLLFPVFFFGDSRFHSFKSVSFATGIFADVSVLQPQRLREMLWRLREIREERQSH